MANLDTRDKRFSALNLGLGFGRVLANPDGAWDQGDRQQAMLCYRGILATNNLVIITDVGLEWTGPRSLIHYAAPTMRLDYTAPKSRTEGEANEP